MLVMTAALPGLASRAGDRESLGLFSARIWHWFSVTVLPASVGLVLFAPYVVTIYFGHDFSPAVPLVQILALSGIVAALSNVFGPAMVVTKRNRWLIVEGTVALAFNVGGNLALVPRFGVTASAWLTVATEIGVCSGSILGMRHRMVYTPLLRASLVPALATLAMIGTALALRPWPVVAMAVAVATFVIVAVVLGGWPVELPCPIPRRFALEESRPGEHPPQQKAEQRDHDEFPDPPSRHDSSGIRGSHTLLVLVPQSSPRGVVVTELTGRDRGSPARDGLRQIWKRRSWIRSADVATLNSAPPQYRPFGWRCGRAFCGEIWLPLRTTGRCWLAPPAVVSWSPGPESGTQSLTKYLRGFWTARSERSSVAGPGSG